MSGGFIWPCSYDPPVTPPETKKGNSTVKVPTGIHLKITKLKMCRKQSIPEKNETRPAAVVLVILVTIVVHHI